MKAAGDKRAALSQRIETLKGSKVDFKDSICRSPGDPTSGVTVDTSNAQADRRSGRRFFLSRCFRCGSVRSRVTLG